MRCVNLQGTEYKLVENKSAILIIDGLHFLLLF